MVSTQFGTSTTHSCVCGYVFVRLQTVYSSPRRASSKGRPKGAGQGAKRPETNTTNALMVRGAFEQSDVFGGSGASLAFGGGAGPWHLRAPNNRAAPVLPGRNRSAPPLPAGVASRRRTPFAAWSPNQAAPTPLASRNVQAMIAVPVARSHSSYAQRQSWKPCPGGAGRYDAHARFVPRLLRDPQDFIRPNVDSRLASRTCATPELEDEPEIAELVGSPWTPRLTHLRRPVRGSRPHSAGSMLSSSGSCASMDTSMRSSSSSLFSDESDGTPVWPYPWNRDHQGRGKHR